MQINPRRAELELATDLAKIRMTLRMRIGIAAAVVIVGLFQTPFGGAAGLEGMDQVRALFSAAMPAIGRGGGCAGSGTARYPARAG